MIKKAGYENISDYSASLIMFYPSYDVLQVCIRGGKGTLGLRITSLVGARLILLLNSQFEKSRMKEVERERERGRNIDRLLDGFRHAPGEGTFKLR